MNLGTKRSVTVCAMGAVCMGCGTPGLYVSVGKVSRKKHLEKTQKGIEILLVGNCRLEYTRGRENRNASEHIGSANLDALRRPTN
jgi:hypothetical protein